jgi:cytosine/adenosine deaminase-related metal-dependent hydrolase
LAPPGTPFADWIRGVIEFLRQPRDSDEPALLAGLAESRAAGVIGLGEIALGLWPSELPPPLAEMKLVVFRELLGLSGDRVAPLLEVARQHVEAGNDGQARGLTYVGLSPHAPYTVHPEVLRRTCELSAARRVPVAMHLAESREELELLHAHTGPLVRLLESLGAWQPDVLPRGRRPLDYLRALATAHRALAVHGNYLLTDEVEFVAAQRERMSIVYCPRTHAYFGHEPYPLAEMLAAGVRVAVGTDSRASNPDLNLWSELRHIADQHPGVSPEEILRMGTLAGAEALGLAGELGSITPGKSARLAVVPLRANQTLFEQAEARPLTPHPSLTSAAGGRESDSF